jgi:hypothetical protein
MPRMNILNTVEREAFNSPPVFSSFQRKQYFDFPSKLRRFAAGLRNPAYQLGFLLSAGYFKAARRFFSPGSFHPRDIEYVARQLEPGAPTVDFAQYHPRARQRHQHTIRTFYGFRACDSAASRLLLKEIAGLVRSQVKPKVIFWRCIDVLVREKIEVPSYTRLTKLILGAARTFVPYRSAAPLSDPTPERATLQRPQDFDAISDSSLHRGRRAGRQKTNFAAIDRLYSGRCQNSTGSIKL